MNRCETEEKLLFTKEFANSAVMSCYDRSRKVAADRWLVRLECQIAVPVSEKFIERYANLPQDEVDAVMKAMGSHITFINMKERNFVDAEEKEAALAALSKQVRDNMTTYVASTSFPEKLFAQKFDQYRKDYLLQRDLGQRASKNAGEEDEPLDFSACFRD